MLEKVKLALRIVTTAFDSELKDLIEAALADLGLAGVTNTSTDDPLIIRAVITYCRANFGDSDEYSRLKASYDEQKAQLKTATGYTDWGDTSG
nr:MAG TPA: head to tail adaptor [Caudoviricetes sp.]